MNRLELEQEQRFLDQRQAVAGLRKAVRAAQGSSIKAGQVVVTAGGGLDLVETVNVTGITAGMRVIPSIGMHEDADENHETLLSVATLAAAAGTGQITVAATFNEPTRGPIRINYLAA